MVVAWLKETREELDQNEHRHEERGEQREAPTCDGTESGLALVVDAHALAELVLSLRNMNKKFVIEMFCFLLMITTAM